MKDLNDYDLDSDSEFRAMVKEHTLRFSLQEVACQLGVGLTTLHSWTSGCATPNRAWRDTVRDTLKRMEKEYVPASVEISTPPKSLRDEFALKAMEVILAKRTEDVYVPQHRHMFSEKIAQAAYAVADAMMEVRGGERR